MHGHVLLRSGDITAAIAAFEAANRAELAYLKSEDIPAPYEWHHEHNLDLLGSSYRYVGQMGKAERELKQAFDLPSSLAVQLFNKRAWPEFLIARGRFDEALAAANVLIAHPAAFVRAVGHVAAGHAMLAAGRLQSAADEANLALRETHSSPATQNLVGPAIQGLQGEFFLRTGAREKGRAMLRELAGTIRALPGPDNWLQTLFTLESIARAARQSGDWEFSEWAARQMIAHDPMYAGSHYALALTAEQAGNVSLARTEFALAGRYWSRADPALSELSRIRASLAAPARIR
jgi:tetratricopeptide (TPR) repeat protein